MLLITAITSCGKHASKSYVIKEPVHQSRSLKRGVSFSFKYVEDVSALATGISWSYNWSPFQNSAFDESVKEHQIDFCPMAWNGIDEDLLREHVNQYPTCEYLLAFNEPNLIDQANLTPTEAAERWNSVQSIADELNLKIIAPAMNYGTLDGYHDPIVWLDEFFSLVPVSNFHGIAVHCYMSNVRSLKNYIDRFKKYEKPIWLTEFCAWEGNVSPESQQRFMADAINYLEAEPDIYRYAWFIPRSTGSENDFPYMYLLTNSMSTQLTELGEIYTQMSSQDKNTYYVEQQIIEAEHYSSISIMDGLGTNNWLNGPKLRLTTESPNTSLELYSILPGQWVEYQVEIEQSKEYELEIRYASFVDAEIALYVDGQLQANHSLSNTGQDYIWQTSNVPLQLKTGKHTIKIEQNEGTFCMNWLRVS